MRLKGIERDSKGFAGFRVRGLKGFIGVKRDLRELKGI